MKKLFLVALLALATVSASAADVTLSYTPVQLKAVQRLVARINAERIAAAVAAGQDTNTVQTVTALGYVQTLFTAKLDAIAQKEKQLIAQELLQNYEEADAATKTSVESTLNVTP